MPKDLRSFIDEVKSTAPAEFARVAREVDPNLELTGVLRKLQERNEYPAVMFEKVRGTDMPVLANVLASRKRLAIALETTEAGLTMEYARRQESPIAPVETADAPVRDVVYTGDQVDLRKMPNIVHCGGDGGPYISSGVCIVRDPETGIHNAGTYRLQIKGTNRLGIYPGVYSHLYHVQRKYEQQGLDAPVAIAIGHHPAFYLAGQYRGPLDVDELHIAGGLLGEALRTVRCETVDLLAPADAEIVIEGRILANVREHEGPFGEYTWYMGPAVDCQVIEVTALTHRKDSIYQDVFSAHPEHNLMGLLGREAMMFQRVKAAVPTVTALTLPFSGTCRHSAYVSVKKEYDGAGKNVALATLAADPFMKMVVVVDDDIDVFNEMEVMWAVTTRVQADRDIFVVPDAYVCELDPSAYDIADRAKRGYVNAKWAIDATKPVGIEFQERADVPETVWKDMNLQEYLA
ncbi:MAG: UbiD family decarboxylase [Thermoleophilia bacterium]